METETNMPARTVRLIRHPSGVYAIETADREGRIFLRPDELADIVQQAYDGHGILAAPSYDTEGAAGVRVGAGEGGGVVFVRLA